MGLCHPSRPGREYSRVSGGEGVRGGVPLAPAAERKYRLGGLSDIGGAMNSPRRLQYAVTAGALIVVVVHHVYPAFHADPFTAAFLLVAVLPWLAPLLKTIKLPGGLEVELRELREELDQTKGAVKSAAIQAQVGAATLSAAVPEGRQTEGTGSPEKLLALGEKYERIRDSMPSGSTRTGAMTRVLAEMFKEAASIRDLDVGPLIASASRGERLAGIAYAHEHPSPERAGTLVGALGGQEDTPFGQYWVLRALRRIAEGDSRVFAGDLCQQLNAYKNRQKPGTDRRYEVTQLLRDVGFRSASPDDS
jgi:hypothetical protein